MTLNFSDAEIDAMLDRIFSPPRVERGSLYCQNSQCPEFLRPKFVWREEVFLCAACGQLGFVVAEKGIPKRRPGQLFGEVRVEYNYCPSLKRYRGIVAVRDENLGPDVGTYTVQNPLLFTEKGALNLAEKLLASLNEGVILDEDLAQPPHAREQVLDFDEPLEKVREGLRQLEARMQDNPFYHARTNVVSQRSEELEREGRS